MIMEKLSYVMMGIIILMMDVMLVVNGSFLIVLTSIFLLSQMHEQLL